MSARRPLVVLATLLGVVGCPVVWDTPDFGTRCTDIADCGDGLMCRPDPIDRTRRCLPPRLPGEPGDSCADPLVAPAIAGPGDPVVLDEVVFFGAAVDDVETTCGLGDTADVVLRFTLTAREGDTVTTPQGIAIEAPAGAVLELRQAGCDGAAIRSGCAAPGQTAYIAELLPGEYDLVIDGEPAAVGVDEGGSRVRVTRIDCPTGALPFDAQRCLRSAPLTPLLSPRVKHTAHALDDGGLVVVGGSGGDGGLNTIEVFDPVLARWQYGDLARRRQGHASVVIDDDLIAIGGLDDDEGSRNFSQVAFRRLALPEQHVRFVRRSTSGFDPIAGPTRALAALGEGGRMLVISTSVNESGIYPLGERTPRVCSADRNCGDGERCLVSAAGGGTCVCLAETCDFERSISRTPIGDPRLRFAAGATLQVMGGQLGLVTGLDELPVGIIDFRSDVVVVNDLGGTLRRFAAIVAIDDRRAWVLGGEDLDGNALADIVEVDMAVGAATLLNGISLPRPVARPRAGRLADAVVIIDDSDEPIVVDLDGGPRPAPHVPARVGSRLVVVVDGDDAERIVLVGGDDGEGPTRTVQALELVPRRAPPPPPPTDCPATPLAEDGVIAGNTAIEDDSFQTTRCQVPALTSWSRDKAFKFSVDEPSSVRVLNVEIANDAPAGAGYAFRLVRRIDGDCRNFEEIACGDSGDPTLAMFVPEIPPGDYTLIVEYSGFTNIFDDDAPYAGSGFEARVLLGPPLSCPSDERDPGDDTPAGAAFLPGDNDVLLLTGRLCPEDVDHVIVEHHGGASDVSTVEYPGVLHIERAVLDTDATLAAGRPIVASTVGGPLASLDGAPAGHYLLTLAAEADAIEFVQWRLLYEPGCVADVGDSLVEALDNRTPGRAPTLTPGHGLERLLCSRSDVDVVVLSPGEGADSSVTLDGGDDVDIALFEIEGDVLGAPRPFTATSIGSSGDMRVELGQLEGPVALRLSVPSSANAFADLEIGIDFAQRQFGDSCTSTLPLREDSARTGTRVVDAIAFSDDHDASELGDCTGFRSEGKDVVFAVELQPGETLTASLLGRDDTDVAIYLLDRCPTPEDTNVCVVGDDEAGRGGVDDITFTHTGAAPTSFFLVLDSFFVEDWTGELGWSIVGP